jgi:hypothetical protein
VVDPGTAWKRAGGGEARLNKGEHADLLSECALSRREVELVRRCWNEPLKNIAGSSMPKDFPCVLLALVELGVLSRGHAPSVPASLPPSQPADSLDDRALRTRIENRLALVMEADYFALLGVSRRATEYEIRRAYEELKAELAPGRILTARNADLGADLDTILEVLEEAFEILSDTVRRERYRRAIEAVPN